MMLHALWWNCGEYADRQEVLLGIYSSQSLRTKAEEQFRLLFGKQWPFSEPKSGHFDYSLYRLNDDIVHCHA